MGRPKDTNMWRNFSAPFTKENSKIQFVRCKQCHKEFAAASATRLKEHTEKCILVIEKSNNINNISTSSSEVLVNHVYMADTLNETSQSTHLTSTITHSDIEMTMTKASSSSTHEPPAKKHMSLFVDTISKTENNYANMLLTRMVVSANLPLSVVENKEFVQFVQYLRPSYKPPSRFILTSSLIPTAYNEVYSEVKRIVEKADILSLTVDGWSNVRGDSLIGHVVLTPDPIFWSSMNATGDAHTGEYIAAEMEKIIIELGPSKIAGVVTDNASNMRAAWTIINNKYPWIIFIGCLAHIGHLICKAACELPEFSTVLKDCKQISLFFQSHHIPKSTFNKHQVAEKISTGLKLPVETRWGTSLSCVDSVLVNRKALVQCAVDTTLTGRLPQDLRQRILYDDFWTQVDFFCNAIRPIVDLITYMESDTPRLSMAYEKFNSLRNHFAMQENNNLCSRLEGIFQKKCKHVNFDALMLANVLDPATKGENVPIELMPKVREFIMKVSPKPLDRVALIGQLAQYTAKTCMFSDEMIWEQANAGLDTLTWWKAFGASAKELFIVARRIISLPCSSAAVERIWSRYGYIHSKTRNRLTDQNAEQLVFLHSNIQFLSSRNN